MSTTTQVAEVRLYNAMVSNNLTLKEAIEAMSRYANDKDFEMALDNVYGNDTLLTDDWDIWSD
jgi:hypothetical protein